MISVLSFSNGFLGGILSNIYQYSASIGINSIIVYIILFSLFSRLFFLYTSFSARKKAYIRKCVLEESEELRKIYNKKFKTSFLSTIFVLVLNIVIVSFIYKTLYNIPNYITFSNNSAEEINAFYTFLSLDLRNLFFKELPNGLIIPIFVYFSSLAGHIYNNKNNNEKNSLSTFIFPLVITMFTFSLPMFICLYWVFSSFFNLLTNFLINLYFKNKPKQYFLDKLLKFKENNQTNLTVNTKKEVATIGNITRKN